LTDKSSVSGLKTPFYGPDSTNMQFEVMLLSRQITYKLTISTVSQFAEPFNNKFSIDMTVAMAIQWMGCCCTGNSIA
jgi:hypothetical protein